MTYDFPPAALALPPHLLGPDPEPNRTAALRDLERQKRAISTVFGTSI